MRGHVLWCFSWCHDVIDVRVNVRMTWWHDDEILISQSVSTCLSVLVDTGSRYSCKKYKWKENGPKWTKMDKWTIMEIASLLMEGCRDMLLCIMSWSMIIMSWWHGGPDGMEWDKNCCDFDIFNLTIWMVQWMLSIMGSHLMHYKNCSRANDPAIQWSHTLKFQLSSIYILQYSY